MCQCQMEKITLCSRPLVLSCVPTTAFLGFKRINSSGCYLLLNTYFTGTGFLIFLFTVLLLIGIQELLDRKIFISDTADIFHKISNWSLHCFVGGLRFPWICRKWCISELLNFFSSCSTFGMNIVSPVTLYIPSITGSHLAWIVFIVIFKAVPRFAVLLLCVYTITFQF